MEPGHHIGDFLVNAVIVPGRLYLGRAERGAGRRVGLQRITLEEGQRLTGVLSLARGLRSLGLPGVSALHELEGAALLERPPLEGALLSASPRPPEAADARQIATTLVEAVRAAHRSGLGFGGLSAEDVLLLNPWSPSVLRPLRPLSAAVQAADLTALGGLLKGLLEQQLADSAELRALIGGLSHADPEQRWSLDAAAGVLASHGGARGGATFDEPGGGTYEGLGGPGLGPASSGLGAGLTYEDPDATPAPNTTPPRPAGPFSALPRLGRYELRGQLGAGGMGVVYRAWDPDLDRYVALKALHPHISRNPGHRERFLREARAVAKLEHPGIVRIYDIGEADDKVFFTMQLVDGASLDRLLREGPLPALEAARVAEGVARALHAAHQQGLVHRDIKPHNVLMLEGETPLLTDFGLVKSVKATNSHMTQQGQILGTPAYMSPEQARGETLDHRCDIYALGAVLYEMLSGRPPYAGGTPMQIVGQVMSSEPAPLGAEVPEALRDICAKAMARAPEDRYADAGRLADDLARFVAARSLAVEPTPQPPSVVSVVPPPTRRSWGLALAVGLTLSLGALWGWQQVRATDRLAVAAESRRQAMAEQLAKLRAQGLNDAADAVFVAFVNLKENAETAALARAWRDEAIRLCELGEASPCLDALGNAYAIAPDEAQQDELLVELARAAGRAWRWQVLRGALSTLAARDPTLLEQLREQQQLLAVYDGDLHRAAQLGGPDASLLQALSSATPTSRVADGAFLWDPDQDGAPALALWDATERRLTLTEPNRPELPVQRTVQVKGEVLTHLGARPSDQAVLVLQPEPAPMLLTDDGLQALPGWPDGQPNRWLEADIDGDGAPESYLTRYRSFDERLSAQEPWRPAHFFGNSSAEDMLAQDLDADGALELVVASSAWSTYDLRLFTRTPGEPLRLKSRLRLGQMDRLVALSTAKGPLLAAFQSADPRERHSLKVFHPELAPMAPQGVHLVRLVDGALKPVGLQPLITSHGPTQTSHGPLQTLTTAADLDGDGRDELVWGTEEHETALMSLDDEDKPSLRFLHGLVPLAAVEVDGDPAAELLVSTANEARSVWILGVGADRLPAQAPALPTRAAPPPGLPSELRSPWRRAEDLLGVGLETVAARRFVQLAELAAGSPIESHAQLRAAQTLESAGERAAAIERYLLAAALPELRIEALGAALRCAKAEHDLAAELDVLEALAKAGSLNSDQRSRVAVLKERLTMPMTPLISAEGLHPAWRVRTPTGLRLTPAGDALQVNVGAEIPLLDMPMSQAGRFIRLMLDISVSELPYSHGWSFGLADPTAETKVAYGAQMSSHGGEGNIFAHVICRNGSDNLMWVPQMTQRLERVEGHRFRVELELDLDAGWARCVVERDGERIGVEAGAQPALRALSGPLSLQLRTLGVGTGRHVIHSFAVAGLTPAAPADDAALEAHRLLTLRRPTEARDVAPADASPLLKATLAMELGGPLSAVGLLPQERQHWIHTALDVWEPAMRAALGDGYYTAFAAAWIQSVMFHPDDPEVISALTVYLDGLDESASWESPSALDSYRRLSLLLFRGRAWSRTGSPNRARADLERVVELAEDQAGRFGPKEAPVVRRVGGSAWLELAKLALNDGRADEAMRCVRRAMEVSAPREVIADLVAADPELSALRQHPDWPQVEAARAF